MLNYKEESVLKKFRNIIKYIGNFLMIFGLIFVFIKLFQMDLDYSVIFEENNIVILILLTLIYGINIISLSVPWRNYLNVITNEKIDSLEVAYIYAKSNIMKYIPGNVFQYVGRNEIAVKANISHADVGLATVLETLTLCFAAIICAMVFNIKGMALWFNEYGVKYFYTLLVIAISIIGISTVLYWSFKDKIKTYINRYSVLITKKGLYTILINLAINIIQHIVFSFMFLVVLVYIVDTDIKTTEVFIIAGAYLLSWIVGFLTIGSPGGIGVRELVICLLLDGIVPENNILLAIILYRMISIFGDIVALLYASALNAIKKHIDIKKN